MKILIYKSVVHLFSCKNRKRTSLGKHKRCKLQVFLQHLRSLEDDIERQNVKYDLSLMYDNVRGLAAAALDGQSHVGPSKRC